MTDTPKLKLIALPDVVGNDAPATNWLQAALRPHLDLIELVMILIWGIILASIVWRFVVVPNFMFIRQSRKASRAETIALDTAASG